MPEPTSFAEREGYVRDSFPVKNAVKKSLWDDAVTCRLRINHGYTGSPAAWLVWVTQCWGSSVICLKQMLLLKFLLFSVTVK